MSLDFTVDRLQTGLFLSTLDHSDKLRLAQNVIVASQELLAGEPVVLPIPEDSPPELPRLILKSKDERYSFALTGNRADFVFSETDSVPSLAFDTVFPEYLDTLLSITTVLKQKHKASIVRIGFVARFFSVLETSSNRFIRENFLNPNRLIIGYETNVSILDRRTMADFEINSWFRLNSLRKRDEPQDDRALRVIFDINTVPERTYNFDVSQVRTFCVEASRLVEAGLDEYFREG